MTMTWWLAEGSAGTCVVIRADDVPAGISPEDHAVGMQASPGYVAAFVETARR
jgi:hypothetical protein